jgi:hypothetical protein
MSRLTWVQMRRTSKQKPTGEQEKRGFWRLLDQVNAVMTFLGSLALIGTAYYLYAHLLDRVQWQDREYTKLETIHSWRLIEKFHQELGSPAYRSVTRAYSTEYFQRKEYWVQAFFVTKTGQTVGWTVTSCDPTFQPRFPGIAGTSIVLWESSMAQVAENRSFNSLSYFYPQTTIHGESRFVEATMLPGSGGFYTMAWGLIDACGDETYKLLSGIRDQPSTDARVVADPGPEAAAFRKQVPINTYGLLSIPPRVAFRLGLGVGRWLAGGDPFGLSLGN